MDHVHLVDTRPLGILFQSDFRELAHDLMVSIMDRSAAQACPTHLIMTAGDAGRMLGHSHRDGPCLSLKDGLRNALSMLTTLSLPLKPSQGVSRVFVAGSPGRV